MSLAATVAHLAAQPTPMATLSTTASRRVRSSSPKRQGRAIRHWSSSARTTSQLQARHRSSHPRKASSATTSPTAIPWSATGSISRSAEYGHVNVIKFACHEDYDYEGKSRDDLSTNCVEALEGVSFTLSGPNNYDEQRTTSGEGQASWEEVPPGAYSLLESPPSGYFPVRVFCTEVPIEGPYPYDADFSGDWEEYPLNVLLTPSTEVEVRAGYWLWCEWYNAPPDDDGYVIVIKYICSQQYDYISRDDYHSVCTELHEGVDFEIEGQEGYSANGTTGSDGAITWSDVPPGQAAIRELPPADYVPYRVFCGTADTPAGPPTSWAGFPIGDQNSVTYEVTTAQYVICEWYNLPYEEDPPQVWIQKYNCPEEAEHHWSYHQLLSACLDSGRRRDASNTSARAASLLKSTPMRIGRAAARQSRAGYLDHHRAVPRAAMPGWRSTASSSPRTTAGNYQQAPVYAGSITLELDYDYVVTCVWFDFLEGHAPPEASPTAGGGRQPLQPVLPSGGTGVEPAVVEPAAEGPGTAVVKPCPRSIPTPRPP